VVPACSPDLAARHGFATLQELRAAPLLHLTSRPDAWEKFFDRAGMAPQQLHGMLFDQFATVAQAAMVGLGVALLPEFLIEDEIASGRLVVPLAARMRSDEAYYLCAPRGRGPHPPLAAFRDWLCAVAQAAETAEAARRAG
jgi:LysR family glycine cleavage system transcriptional activator